MRLRHWYLALMTVGLLLPYSQFGPWLLMHGLNLPLFFRELFANRIAASFALDVLVSAVVLLVLVGEGRRLRMRALWLPITATVLVGVSLGLPLFLYLRERQLDQSENRSNATVIDRRYSPTASRTRCMT